MEFSQSSIGDLVLEMAILITDANSKPIFDAALYVKDSVVVAAGSREQLAKLYPQLPRMKLENQLVAPALINAHIHSPMGFFRGLSHAYINNDVSTSMIEDVFFPAEKALDAHLIEALSYSYLVECLKNGIACVADAYFYADGIAKACEKIGIRAFIGEHIADLGGPVDAGSEHWKKTKKWIENWPYSERVQPMVYAHAADTVSRSLLSSLNEFSLSQDLVFHMHLSQTEGEKARVLAREGLSPVDYVESVGLLREKAIFVHLVSASLEEYKKLAGSGCFAVMCPVSETIYERLPSLTDWHESALPYCLASDGAASNDGSDLLEELRFFALMLRDRGLDAKYYQSAQLLSLVSTEAAKAYHRSELSRLSPGGAADLVCYELDLASAPHTKPLENLIYSSGSKRVRHVMVGGEWVVWDKKLTRLNESDLYEQYRGAVSELYKRIGWELTL